MIINLRGTNGAGKSTIVHRLMEKYETIIKLKYGKEFGKKLNPSGYICQRDTRRLFIPGHYQIQNGGVDTLPSYEYAYRLIMYHHELGADVIYEGRNFNEGLIQLFTWQKLKLNPKVIFIDYPLNKCIDAVRERGHTISVVTIARLYDKSLKEYETLKKAGLDVYMLEREEAMEQVEKWLGVNHVSKSSAECL